MRNVRRFSLAASVLTMVLVTANAQETAKPKFNIKIADNETTVVDIEDSGVIDPTQRIALGGNQFGNGLYMSIRGMKNETLHLSHFPSFLVNNQFVNGANLNVQPKQMPLPNGPGGKKRVGYMTQLVQQNLHITQSLELHPTKAKKAGEKRLLSTVLITHTVENKTNAAVNLGMRIYMDTYVVTNDGCLFASPVTHPGKILDGMVLEGKTLPPYLQMLQNPNLQNPGFVSTLTLNVGSKYEKATKLVLTRHGLGFNQYDMPAQPAMFDSGIGLFWPVKELKPGAKRECAYCYGEGIAVAAESEGRFQLSLGGSYEPGKLFTVSALVADPALGQTLSLDLPKGIERIEGREVQPVAALSQDQEYSTVLWKCRVVEPGSHVLRVRSSTGMTQGKTITVTAEK